MNIGALIAANDLTLDQTIYFDQGDSFLKYPLFRLGEVNIANASKYLQELPSAKSIMDEYEKIEREKGARKYEAERNACLEKIKLFKRSFGKNPLGYNKELHDQYDSLVSLKKSLSKKIETKQEDTRRIIYRRHKVSTPQDLKCLKIRAIGIGNTFNNVTMILPQLEGLSNITTNMPLFTYELSSFKTRMGKEKSAIEGGPCIIGVDELYLRLRFKNGAQINYDFITGCEEGPTNDYIPNTYPLAEVINKAYLEITEMDIIKKQHGVTLQHFIEVHRLISIAKALDLPVMIGIPDHAYKSQWKSVLGPFYCQFNIAEKIEDTVDDITNEFVLLVNNIASEVGYSNFEILHSSNEPVMRCLSQARNGMRKNSQRLISNMNKRDAVLDYICMPVIPNYTWGATNILEVNNVAEFESVKGAIKGFPQVSLSALMFPFLPNLSGYDSMYHSINNEKLFIGCDFREVNTKFQHQTWQPI